MAAYSVIGPDGRAYGPADEGTLAQWAREGRLTAQTVVRRDADGAQMSAQFVPGLAPHLGLPPHVVNALIQQPFGPAGGPLQYADPRGYMAAATGGHGLTAFSTPLVVFLHFITFGIFSWIHFGLMHDRLPRARHDDPSAAKAICFMLIPFFNVFYWRFFEGMRICDRINEQRHFAGLPPTAPRGLAIAYGVVMIVPYINFLVGFPILGSIYYGMLQASVNELVAVTHGRQP